MRVSAVRSGPRPEEYTAAAQALDQANGLEENTPIRGFDAAALLSSEKHQAVLHFLGVTWAFSVCKRCFWG